MGLNLRIEKLTPNSPDLLTLSEWFHEEWGYYHPGQVLADRIADTKKLCSNSNSSNNDGLPVTWVAYNENDDLVASINLSYDDLPTHLHLNPWLASFFVKKEFRGQGIGSILFKYTMDMAPKFGIKDLYLFTKDQEKLYTSFGWETIEKDHFLGDDISIMKYSF